MSICDTQYHVDKATSPLKAEIQQLRQQVAELEELNKDRQSDLDFEFNRAEQNEFEVNALKEQVAELKEKLEV